MTARSAASHAARGDACGTDRATSVGRLLLAGALAGAIALLGAHSAQSQSGDPAPTPPRPAGEKAPVTPARDTGAPESGEAPDDDRGKAPNGTPPRPDATATPARSAAGDRFEPTEAVEPENGVPFPTDI